MHIEEAGQLIQRLDDVGNLIRVTDYTRLTFLYEKGFDNVNVIIKHHQIAEMPGHPISLRYQSYHIIGMGYYLAFGIVLTIDVGLALGNADDRIIYEFL